MNRVWRFLGRLPRGGDQAGQVEPEQPDPLEIRVSRMKTRSGWVTALFRAWQYDEIPRCRLCPKGTCTAVGGCCLLLIPDRVEDKDAALYRIERPPERST